MENILILGNPNSGKSLLFNRLTGLKQKVANFPGVTVEIRSGQFEAFTVQDFPGTYSLAPLTPDEDVAVKGIQKYIESSQTKAIVCVLDGTRFERSLMLLLQLIEKSKLSGRPLIAAINMMDEVNGKSSIDFDGLRKELEIPVIGISARTGEGLPQLKDTIKSVQPLKAKLSESLATPLSLKIRARDLHHQFGPKGDVFLKKQNRLDDFFLSHFFGPIVFTAIMIFLFQSIFSWAKPLMEMTSGTVETLGTWTSSHLSEGMLRDFINDAVFAGFGSFLVFAPQIFVLFLVIGLLEDSGYLARAAIILHKPLSFFGLSGKSFVPLLSGHACAIPAILAARTIESPKKRFLTMIAAPFMACSARLPVYALLISGFVPATAFLGGFITLQGFAFFGLFALGIVTALIVTSLLDRVSRKSASLNMRDTPFIVELPPYRLPALISIFRNSFNQTYAFIKNAGAVIFSVSVIVWALGYFPNGSGHLDTSYMAILGRAIEPIFAPMGLDWKIGVGVLTSFLAREVFVATLGTLYGLEDAGENLSSLSTQLSEHGMTAASAIGLLVFYALAMQCVSTLAVIKKETGSYKVPTLVFISFSILAYSAATVSYWIFK